MPDTFESFFTDPFFRFAEDSPVRSSDWSPAVEVHESEDHVTFTLEVPGIDRDNLSIDVENGVITFTGEKRRHEEEKEKGESIRTERWYGRFSRSFRLPESLDSENISANLRDGILEVRVPKREETKPRRIEVEVS